MAFTLPDLPYAHNALEPYIDEATMKIHHGKHHAGYVANLNKALEGNKELSGKSVEEILKNIDSVPENIRQAVINNAGGHANHSLFWTIMSSPSAKATDGKPKGALLKAIESEYGGFEKFKEIFGQKALTLFGSGWVFLTLDSKGKLSCKRHSFQNSPISSGNTPILGLDVWEHSYYIKYQNRRAEYIEAFWNIINWNEVERRFSSGGQV